MLKKRFPTNIVVFFMTTVPLFLTATLTNGFAVQILNDVPVDLNSFNFQSNMPNYTDYVDNHTYISGNVVFDPSAMAGFYRLTQNFMNSLLDPNFLNEDQIQWKESGSGFSLALNDNVSIGDLLKDYWALVFVVVLIVLITLLIPITGLVFCCCRCCGNCGAKSEPSDAKKDYCKKVVAGAVIIVLGTILLLTVVCAFDTNQQMHKGTTDFPQNIRKTYSDATAFLDGVNGQADNLLVKNYQEFSTIFKNSLRDSGNNVLVKMDSWQNAREVLDLNNFVVAMPDIKVKLQLLKDETDKLKQQVTEANKVLIDMKSSLTTALSACPNIIRNECMKTSEQISSIEFNINITLIPDASDAINTLGGLDITELQIAAESGKAKLDELGLKINSTLKGNIEDACNQIDNAGNSIRENNENMTKAIKDLREQINSANNTLENAYGYITKYSPYFYYVGLILSCILLLIPACIILGLLWGVCGKRSEKFKNNSCSKETGSIFLMSGVLLIFIFTILLGVLTCVMLIFGLAVDRVICYPLRNPDQSTVINIIDAHIDKNKYIDFNVSINEILVRCSEDESLYKVFNLSSKFDLSDLSKRFDINGTVAEIIQNITLEADTLIPKDNFSILSSSELAILNQLAVVNPDVNVSGFESQLDQNLLNEDLQLLKRSLQEISTVSDMSANIKQIDTFETNILQPMSKTSTEILDLAKTLDNDLKMNHSSFSEAITAFLNSITAAQEKLSNDSTEIISAAEQFGEVVKQQAQGYLDRVTNELTNDLGRCGSLNVAFNSALVATCDKIFMPWNGFWVALFISMLVFVPTLIVSVALASLYRNYKLTGHSFKPGKSSMRKNQTASYPRDVGRYPPKSRYDDMAPSNWILLHPEGATRSRILFEYERPPSYYPGFFEL